MANILMSVPAFWEEWAWPVLSQYVQKGMKVVIVSLSYGEGWINDSAEWNSHYGRHKDEYEKIAEPFRRMGIREKDIRLISEFDDTHETAVRKIREADVLYLAGGYPDWSLQRMYDLDIKEEIIRFEGTVIGASAGAMIQLDTYHLTPEEGYPYQYQEGLGMLGGFDVEVHYEEDLRHIEAMIRCLEDTGRPLAVLPDQGGLLIDGEHLELMGDAFILDVNDLDELYQTYDGLRMFEPAY